MLSHRHISARVSTYQRDYLATLRKKELSLQKPGDRQSGGKPSTSADDPDWQDAGLLIVEQGGLTQEATEDEVGFSRLKQLR